MTKFIDHFKIIETQTVNENIDKTHQKNVIGYYL